MILDMGCGNIPREDVNIDLCVPNDILKGKGLARMHVIETTNPKKTSNFIKADAHLLTFRSNSFSKVFCAHAIEHLENPQKAILEMLRGSKSTVEIIVPIWQVDFNK